MRPLKYLGLAAAAMIAAGAVTAAAAADFPRKPVTVVVGYGAGGGTDSYARALASVAPEYINRQPLIVVNKPGGSGIPAAKYVADSKARRSYALSCIRWCVLLFHPVPQGAG